MEYIAASPHTRDGVCERLELLRGAIGTGVFPRRTRFEGKRSGPLCAQCRTTQTCGERWPFQEERDWVFERALSKVREMRALAVVTAIRCARSSSRSRCTVRSPRRRWRSCRMRDMGLFLQITPRVSRSWRSSSSPLTFEPRGHRCEVGAALVRKSLRDAEGCADPRLPRDHQTLESPPKRGQAGLDIRNPNALPATYGGWRYVPMELIRESAERTPASRCAWWPAAV